MAKNMGDGAFRSGKIPRKKTITMKTTHLLCGALASAVLLVPSARAADLRWVGLDINAASLAPAEPLATGHTALAVTAVGGTTTVSPAPASLAGAAAGSASHQSAISKTKTSNQ